MIDIIKPLINYKKYIIANKLLKESVRNKTVFTKLGDSPSYQISYLPIPLSHFFKDNPKLKPERVVEAIRILKSNCHIILIENPDAYRIKFECSDIGEIANNDGFYINQIWKSFAIIIVGTPISIVGIIKLILWLK